MTIRSLYFFSSPKALRMTFWGSITLTRSQISEITAYINLPNICYSCVELVMTGGFVRTWNLSITRSTDWAIWPNHQTITRWALYWLGYRANESSFSLLQFHWSKISFLEHINTLLPGNLERSSSIQTNTESIL